MNSKGNKHMKTGKNILSQYKTDQNTEDASIERPPKVLNTKRTDFNQFSFGADSTIIGGGTTVVTIRND